MKDDINSNLKDVLATIHLEFTKSAFLIDLIKPDSGSLYVEIVQSIRQDEEEVQSIKINSSILPELIKVLQAYQEKINPIQENQKKHQRKPNVSKKITTIKLNHFTKKQKDEIQKCYLKGISLDELAIQFRQKKEVIKMILRNRNIEIVSKKQSTRKYWKKSLRKRR